MVKLVMKGYTIATKSYICAEQKQFSNNGY